MSEDNPYEHLSNEDLIAICVALRNQREQIAQEIEALGRVKPCFMENQTPLLNYTVGYTADENGDLLKRTEVLQAIRGK